MDISGKVAIVTGGASGIGRAVVVALATKGASIAVADVDDIGGGEAVALAKLAGGDAKFYRIDITDPAELSLLFAQAQHDFGLIDIVCNNAGIVSGNPKWPDTSLAKLKAVIDVNFTGVVLGTRLAIEAMRGDGGVIINTASTAAFAPRNEDAAYTATQAAVVSFTQSCKELATTMGIRVNTVCPGMTATPMIAKTGDGLEPAVWITEALNSVELIQPSEIAEAVIRIIEDETMAGDQVIVANRPLL